MIEWEDLVLQTAERFGGTMPHPDTAATISQAYAKAPNAVIRAIDRIALEWEAGSVRSPWGILKSRVAQIQTEQRTTTRANDRDKAIDRAEQWIRNAGLHYDRETELLDELFGDRGQLRPHDTPETRKRIHELWRELRPVGETIEHEHEVFMARWAEQNGHLEKPKTAPSEPVLKAVT